MGSSHFFFDGSYSGNMLLLGSDEPVFRGSRSVFCMEENSKRRPFFTSPEELIDEEYYDEQLPEKKRRLTPDQVNLLEKSFEVENKLEPERKSQLAKKLGLQPRQVAVWFQNRRARWKTKQLERDYDLLKASYDSLLSDYDSIVKDNQKLKSEVVSLTEKLVSKEVGGTVVVGQKSDPLIPADKADVILKSEDRLSSGSGGSAVVDEDGGGPHLVDSGDSYFPENDYGGCMGPIDGIQSEEDDGSDDNRNYISEVFVATEHHQNEEEESLGWWVWP